MREKSNQHSALRDAAEAQLALRPIAGRDMRSAEELLHELQVNQIELEMQNDELRRSQIAADELRDRYVDLYDCAPVGYLTLSPEGKIEQINIIGAKLLGVERKKLMHSSFSSFVAAEDRDRWHRQFTDVLSRDDLTVLELVLQHADGVRFYARLDCQRLNEFGIISVVRISLIDITEIKEAEKALLAKTRLLDNIVDNIPNMIFLKSASDLRFELFNKAGEELLGHSRNDLLGKGNYDFWSKEQGDWFTAEDRRALASLKNIEIPEEAIKTASGETRYLHTWKVAVRDESGVPSHLLGISVDITERIALTNRLKDAYLNLISAQEDARRRLSSELHDRTSPNLAAIDINLKSISAELTPEIFPHLVERLEDVRALITDTTNSIRDICADMRPPLLDYAGLAAAIESYAVTFKRRTGIAVQFDCADHTTRHEQHLESLMFRIFQEALTNCTKHAEATSITVTLDNASHPISMTIIDDGVGFDSAQLGITGGTGIGLINMREITEVLGGRFTLESSPGKGTRIHVEIK